MIALLVQTTLSLQFISNVRVRGCANARAYAKRARFESLLSDGDPGSSTLTAFTFSKFPTYKDSIMARAYGITESRAHACCSSK